MTARWWSEAWRPVIRAVVDHPEWTQRQIADALGCTQQWVSKVLNHPESRNRLAAAIGTRHAHKAKRALVMTPTEAAGDGEAGSDEADE